MCLLQGLDDVGRTEQHAAEIDAFRMRYRRDLPFLASPTAG
jgi:3-isopropylmalate dehydratase small subunit